MQCNFFLNPKEIDGVPVTGRPVDSRTVLGVMHRNNSMQLKGNLAQRGNQNGIPKGTIWLSVRSLKLSQFIGKWWPTCGSLVTRES